MAVTGIRTPVPRSPTPWLNQLSYLLTPMGRTCDRGHSRQFYSAAPLGGQATSTMISHSVTLFWHWANQRDGMVAFSKILSKMRTSDSGMGGWGGPWNPNLSKYFRQTNLTETAKVCKRLSQINPDTERFVFVFQDGNDLGGWLVVTV